MTNAEIDLRLATDVMMYQPRVMPRGTLAWATPDSGWRPQSDWSPSSNIAQAFECAEKGFHLCVQRQYQSTKPWSAVISMTQDWRNQKAAQSDTPAMAICLAILAALEKGIQCQSESR